MKRYLVNFVQHHCSACIDAPDEQAAEKHARLSFLHDFGRQAGKLSIKEMTPLEWTNYTLNGGREPLVGYSH